MSSDNTIRIGMIGAGSMARSHVNMIRNIAGTEVTAICDPDEERLKEVSEALGIPFASPNHSDVIAREDVDAVVVASPDFAHAEQAVEALRAGKHVMCEKPMVTSLDECRQVVEAADASDAVFMIGQVCRFSPGFITGKKLVDEGAIGELFLVESEYAHDYTHVEGHKGWRIDPGRLREPFLGGACHAVDVIRWVGGQPTEAFAYSNRKALTHWPVDDCTVAVYRFESGALGKVVCSVGCKRAYTMRSVFWGTSGTVICDNTSTEITLYVDESDSRLPDGVPSGQRVPIEIPVGTQVKMTEMENRAWISAIRGDAPLTMDAREGAKTVAACLAAIESSKTGSPVEVARDF
jgi:predicted dehydrogenase